MCVGPEFGRIAGSGLGLEQEQRSSDRWSAALLDLRLGYRPVSWLAVTLGGEAGVAVERPRFGVELSGQATEVYRPEPWVFRGRLGIGVVQPSE